MPSAAQPNGQHPSTNRGVSPMPSLNDSGVFESPVVQKNRITEIAELPMEIVQMRMERGVPVAVLDHEVRKTLSDLDNVINNFCAASLHPAPGFGLRSQGGEAISTSQLLKSFKEAELKMDHWSQPREGGPFSMLIRKTAIDAAGIIKQAKIALVRGYMGESVGEDKIENLLQSLVETQEVFRTMQLQMDATATQLFEQLVQNSAPATQREKRR